MNVSFDWLKEFVDFDLTPAALRDLITARVAAVDAVEPLRQDLAPIVVARVVEVGKHPDADHLSVTKVDAGTGELLDVVCGAPNVRAGKLYPFAKTGTVMPGGLTVERRKIRGAISNGMLCSARELRVGADHEGILELNVDAAPGTPFLAAVPAGDARLVVDVSPVRGDLLSHLGIGREVAAALGGALRLPVPIGAGTENSARPARASGAEADGVEIAVEDVGGCPRYAGAILRGVTVGPSPDWLVRRIEAVGGRTINNVVDATNYMLHGVGQPMHAFDLARLAGSRVLVRRARAGERLRTLDGVERVLDESMTVIADAERAQAVAGVIGGAESEVTATTTDVFLEVASFDAVRVRATRRALGLSTDASYRFERGVDAESLPEWVTLAAELIRDVAGGTWTGAVDLNPVPSVARTVTLRAARVRQLLGEPVPASEIVALLRTIGFAAAVAPGTEMLEGHQELRIVPPSWRRDVADEVDLIEEVARLRGYDTFPSDLRSFRPSTVPDAPLHPLADRLRERLAGLGLYEVRPLPFVDGRRGLVRVANPIAETEAFLRTDVLDTLATRAEANLARMQRNVRLFEIGAVFAPGDGEAPVEEMRVAALIMGDRRPAHFTDPKPPQYDEWDAKYLGQAMAETVFGRQAELRSATSDDRNTKDPAGAADSRSGLLWSVSAGDRTVGSVRRVLLDAPPWAAPAFGVEVRLGSVLEREPARVPPAAQYRPLPTGPASDRDVTLLVPQAIGAANVETVMRAAGGDILERVALVDEFRGPTLPPDTRALTWRLTFRAPDRTLRDKEIEGRREKVLRSLERELGVRLRIA